MPLILTPNKRGSPGRSGTNNQNCREGNRGKERNVYRQACRLRVIFKPEKLKGRKEKYWGALKQLFGETAHHPEKLKKSGRHWATPRGRSDTPNVEKKKNAGEKGAHKNNKEGYGYREDLVRIERENHSD